jgi:hypothetical protein
MEITLLKATGPGDRDRAYLGMDRVAWSAPVHVLAGARA